MDRRKIAAVTGGLVLVVAAALVLRNEAAPAELQRYVDPSIELIEATEPEKPANARTSALDPDTLQLAWAGNAEAYEVRWNDRTQLVSAAEAELTGLNPDESVEVEIRSVNSVGKRSDPLVVEATPRQLVGERLNDKLIQPIERFDGPESLDPRRWRVTGEPAQLGLRKFGSAKRLDIEGYVHLQSNRPLRLGVPDSDGVVGRVMLTAAASQESTIRVHLLPEPFQDLPYADKPVQGIVQLELSGQGTRLNVDPALPLTARQIALGDSPATGVAPDARHRWEVRILPDAVIALRDGVVVAAEAVAVPWTVARPRISVEGKAMLDSFGIGGVPEREIPATVVQLRSGTDLGKVPSKELEDALSARLVLFPRGDDKEPITVEYGGKSLPTKELTAQPRSLYADLPLIAGDPVVRTNRPVDFAQVVTLWKPAARPRGLPRLPDREPSSAKALPKLKTMHDSGVEPPTQFPPSGRILVTAELPNGNHVGIKLEIDDRHLLTLPTTEDGPGARGRHEVWLNTSDFPPGGGHRVKLTVLPPDHGEPVTTEAVFEVRKSA